jgi:hypothetical protein
LHLKIDFVRDYAEILPQRLQAKGCPAVVGEADQDTIAGYLNLTRRFARDHG